MCLSNSSYLLVLMLTQINEMEKGEEKQGFNRKMGLGVDIDVT